VVVDFSSPLLFQAMVKPLVERILEPVQRALDSAGVRKEDIVSVEVVGDSHRILAVGEKLAEFFGKPPSKRTNSTEVVAKVAFVMWLCGGCAVVQMSLTAWGKGCCVAVCAQVTCVPRRAI
jgi:enamine deaminase RidA (YjgF/YER057c/UK114 family)